MCRPGQAALGVYVSQSPEWGIVFGVATAPDDSQPGGTYVLHYQVSA